MRRKILLTLLVVGLLFCLTAEYVAASFQVNAYLFYGEGCPHCAKECQFFSQIKEQCPNLKLYEFEVYYNQTNNDLLKRVSEILHPEISGVPFLVVGDRLFLGYAEGISPGEIESRIAECSLNRCQDSIASIVGAPPVANNTNTPQPTGAPSPQEEQVSPSITDKMITLPFVGEIQAAHFSVPVLAVLLGVLDGFNPCAMWVLLFLISLLLGTKDKKKMWILGATFIVASALVYFVFMSAWLNLILFLGFVVWIRTLIGGLALFGGGYSIREFFFNKNGGCKVTNSEGRQKIFQRAKSAISQNSFLLALGGIIVLAFLVNLVELICSAGLPVVFTQVLALNEIASWHRYLYILLYIFFFMLDDLFVFFVAMATLELTGVTTKYTKYSRLIGGLIMLLVGLLLIFRSGWLMFG